MKMAKRAWWTVDDLEELRDAYSKAPLVIPKNLIDKHGRSGCHTKAERLGLSGMIRRGYPDLTAWDVARCAYLAGIVDGEGTIAIIANKRWSKRRDKQYVYHRAVVCIANTDYKLRDYLISLNLGGLCYDHSPMKEGWKQSFQWSLTSSATVYSFLKVIEPYLIIKKDKAIEVMEWLETNKLHGLA